MDIIGQLSAQRYSVKWLTWLPVPRPGGALRSCSTGQSHSAQRELSAGFGLPTQWVNPAGRHQNIEARDIFFMALKKICNLESEAEAQGCRFFATARWWEGRSQRLPSPCWRLMVCADFHQVWLTLRVGAGR